MNVIRGMDRIALVLGIVAILPGFFLGEQIVHEEFRTVTLEYKLWEKKHNDRINYLNDKAKKLGKRVSPLKEFLGAWADDPILQDLRERKPPKYQYPPPWQRIIGGLIIALLSFLVVLFTIRGMTRGVKWIFDGFRDEKTNK